jgi:hypothetical protein
MKSEILYCAEDKNIYTQGSRHFSTGAQALDAHLHPPSFNSSCVRKWIHISHLSSWPSVLQHTWYIANGSNILSLARSVCDAFQSCREIVLLLFCVIYSRITCSITNTHSQPPPPLSNPSIAGAISVCDVILPWVCMCEAAPFWIW